MTGETWTHLIEGAVPREWVLHGQRWAIPLSNCALRQVLEATEVRLGTDGGDLVTAGQSEVWCWR